MTQEMCDNAVDGFLPALEFALDWFVTNVFIEIIDNAAFSNDDINLDDMGSDSVKLFRDGMGLNTTFFNNVSLDDDNFDNGDPETTIHVGLRAQCNGCKQRKAWKKELSKELILVAWHLTRWWD